MVRVVTEQWTPSDMSIVTARSHSLAENAPGLPACHIPRLTHRVDYSIPFWYACDIMGISMSADLNFSSEKRTGCEERQNVSELVGVVTAKRLFRLPVEEDLVDTHSPSAASEGPDPQVASVLDRGCLQHEVEKRMVPQVVLERVSPVRQILDDLLHKSDSVPVDFYFWRMDQRGVCLEDADRLLADVVALQLYWRSPDGDIHRMKSVG